MWNPGCELSSTEPWTSCSSYLSYSPVMQWSTHVYMDSAPQLQQVLQVKAKQLFVLILSSTNHCMFIIFCRREVGEDCVGCLFTLHRSYDRFIKCLQYVKWYFNKSGVSAVAPAIVPAQEHFPKMGYFHKSMPSRTDVPPQKIAGISFWMLDVNNFFYALLFLHFCFSCVVQCMSLWDVWSFLCFHGWLWQTQTHTYFHPMRGER